MSHFNLSALTEPLSSQVGLTHAVLQSLYNHAESTQNDRARMGHHTRGGHWSHEWIKPVGSRDWTLKRAKLTDETVRLTQRFSQEALIWLTEQDHVETVEVKAWKDRPNQVGRTITIMLTDGSVLDIPLTNGGPINE